MTDEVVLEPEAIRVLLTVEQRQDGQYYVMFAGQEFLLATPISYELNNQRTWPNSLLYFNFAALLSEEAK